MRLRTAIKIMRYIEEPWRYTKRPPQHTREQVSKAWKICDRKWRDRRVPDLTDEEQLEMRGEIFTQLLLGGPMFGGGILEGLVPDEVLDEARAEVQKLEQERYNGDVADDGLEETQLGHEIPVDSDVPCSGGEGSPDG